MHATINDNRVFIVGLLLYYFAACVSNDIYIPSMPLLRDVFTASFHAVQNSMTAWYLGLCLPMLFLGPIADAIGRRTLMLWGLVFFIIASAGCMLSQTVLTFTLFRFIQGICVASLNIASFSTIRNYFSYHDSIKLYAWLSVTGSSAPILGPILGGFFVTYLSWRVDFLFLIIIGFIACWMLYQTTPETKHLSTRDDRSLLSTYCDIFRNVAFFSNSFAIGIVHGCLIIYLTSAPYVLIDQLHFTPSAFGFIQCPIFVTGMLGGLSVPMFARILGPNQTKHFGLALTFIALTLMLVTNYFINMGSVYLYIPFIVVYALGLALSRSILTADAMAAIEKGIGAGSAIMNFVMAIAGAVGSWLVGSYYKGHILDIAWLLFIMNIIGIGCYLIPKLYVGYNKI